MVVSLLKLIQISIEFFQTNLLMRLEPFHAPIAYNIKSAMHSTDANLLYLCYGIISSTNQTAKILWLLAITEQYKNGINLCITKDVFSIKDQRNIVEELWAKLYLWLNWSPISKHCTLSFFVRIHCVFVPMYILHYALKVYPYNTRKKLHFERMKIRKKFMNLMLKVGNISLNERYGV